jgi:hypothetical protein
MNILKLSFKRKFDSNFLKSKYYENRIFKIIFKKNGKLYSSLIPQFFKKFSISNKNRNLKCKSNLKPERFKKKFRKNDRTLLLQSSEIVKNQYKDLKI